jgi:hypothetical protein
MAGSRTSLRSLGAGWVLGVVVAIALSPSSGEAKPLCLANTSNSLVIVLTSAKFKKGKVSPLVGYLRSSNGSFAFPVSGASMVSDDGTSFGMSLQRANVGVISGGGSLSPGPGGVFSILFTESDGRLDPSDASGGYMNSTALIFVVVDCDSAPSPP